MFGFSVMRYCSYCGAEYSDESVECPIDHNRLVARSISTSPQPPDPNAVKRDIPLLPPAETKDGWVTILTTRSSLESNIVIGRLRASRIQARPYNSDIGQLFWRDRMIFVQVRSEDYNAARDLLNEA